MFSKRQYKRLSVKRAGAKGFGLFAEQDIAAGSFIIEYLGEVLEEEEYVRRKAHYIAVGQRHYYFMNVGNGEVIDACRKGNQARFINHSCDPNCETQKWLVRGELAIGLFALTDVKSGEELTFDYNFERYGDKPMRCYCGAGKCRKFIGGTAESTADVEVRDVEGEDEHRDMLDWAQDNSVAFRESLTMENTRVFDLSIFFDGWRIYFQTILGVMQQFLQQANLTVKMEEVISVSGGRTAKMVVAERS